MPDPGDFSVTAGGTSRTVSAVSIDGDTVTLELATAVVYGETVTVSYTPGTNPIRYDNGTDAAALTSQSVTNNTLPVLSSERQVVSEGDVLEFTVTLSPASLQTVEVAYQTLQQTARSGSDYTSTSGTLMFSPGDTEKTISVETLQDDLDEGTETLFIALRSAVNATLFEGRSIVGYSGTILDDDEPLALEVESDWGLVPSGLTVGDSFRLLFVSSTTRHAGSIATGFYDSHVRDAVASGHADIQAYADHVRTLGSTDAIDARDHTATTYTTSDLGVPIYWLAGDKVADDYSDLYDGDWDSNTPTDEFGDTVVADTKVFTGSEEDGTGAGAAILGAPTGTTVRTGKPGTSGEELDSGEDEEYTEELSFYGLSGVFTVIVSTTVPPALQTATVDGSTLNLTYDQDLDADSEPDPGDFAVTAGGAAVIVSAVSISGQELTLTLAAAVEASQTVTISYTPGTNPIRNGGGTDAAALTNQPVTNNTLPVLSISYGVGTEGEAIELTVTLSAASDRVVLVTYTTDNGTATEGDDFTPALSGLRFSATETSKTITIQTLQDALVEGSESFSRRSVRRIQRGAFEWSRQAPGCRDDPGRRRSGRGRGRLRLGPGPIGTDCGRFLPSAVRLIHWQGRQYGSHRPVRHACPDGRVQRPHGHPGPFRPLQGAGQHRRGQRPRPHGDYRGWR